MQIIVRSSRKHSKALGRDSRAFTLPEMMVAVLAGTLILLSITVVFMTSTASFVSMGNYINIDRSSRNALDQMTRNIRKSNQLTSFSSSVITFLYDASGVTNLTYRFDSGADVLTEEWNSPSSTTTNVLLTGCANLTFSLFDRNLASTTSVTNNTGKVLSVAWRCSATNLFQISSENMQQAQIVIRNQP
jgi:Tfp pilus assembly protein PilW